ncbi:MAG: hypothetical protein F6K36_17500 [Symploca sp. SIO3C6]|nr:hypothetical protein [Symploca sp. SIO3C6]
MHNITANHLINSWQARYTPDFSTLTLKEDKINFHELMKLTSSKGREKTASEVQRLLDLKCEIAGIRSNIIFSYIPNIVKLTDYKHLSQYIQQIYHHLMEIYKQQPPLSLPASISNTEKVFLSAVNISGDFFKQWVTPVVRLPTVQQVFRELQPKIEQLRIEHLSTGDRRAIGFVSTQFHFSTTFILNQLQLSEQVLLSPYFKFVEEQVCIPWQRVCEAAAQHTPGSRKLALVQQILPASGEIAVNVHRRACQMYPNHRSRRGKLNEQGVKASSIRDIEMFQAYLWLCVLEDSMAAIEKELLPLCVLVFPSIDVDWELVEQIVPLLIDEFRVRMKPEQMLLLQPYTEAMQQLFGDASHI